MTFLFYTLNKKKQGFFIYFLLFLVKNRTQAERQPKATKNPNIFLQFSERRRTLFFCERQRTKAPKSFWGR
jgi:hypothetical protein